MNGELKIEILVSTMNYKFFENPSLFVDHPELHYLVINQISAGMPEIQIKMPNTRVRLLNFYEVGLSKSRNRAISNSIADICVIADDDLSFDREIVSALRTAYRDPRVDFVTYRNSISKTNSSKVLRHSERSVLRVTSAEISFRRESILKNKIQFDERFGLGSVYISAEENIFLSDCLRKGLRGILLPETLVYFQDLGTGHAFNRRVAASKGALGARLYGYWGFLFVIFFSVKKYFAYRDYLSFFSFLAAAVWGFKDFFKTRRILK